MGIPGNEAVDKLVGEVHPPPFTDCNPQMPAFFSYLWSEITCKLHAADCQSHIHPQHLNKLTPGYGNNIPSRHITTILLKLTLNSTKIPIKHFQSVSITCMAWLFCLLSRYAPIGRYQQKMRSKHKWPYVCPCSINSPKGDGFEASFTMAVQMHKHILYQCLLYY